MPRRRGGLAALFAGALALRLALAAGAWVHPERLMAEDDSAEYLRLARNLADGHGFSQASAPPYDPDVRRTPLYPAVLAGVFALPAAGRRAAALTGAVLSAVTVLATARLAAPIAGAPAALAAAALLAIDLTSASYATQLLTEPFFTLLLVLSFTPLVERRARAAAGAAAAGLTCGLAALCRPIAVFAALALAPACRLRSTRWREAASLTAIALLVSAAMTAGWTLRNYRAAGTATVSSVAATNMYFHRAAYVEAWLRREPVEDLRAEWQRDFDARASSWSERARVRWMNEHGRGLVLAHPFVYAVVALRGAARMLTPDHVVLATLTGGYGTTAFRALRAAGWVQLAVVYLLAAFGTVRLCRASPVRAAVPLAAIAYFLLIGGPEMYPRFRVPMMPFVCVLAASAIALDPPA